MRRPGKNLTCFLLAAMMLTCSGCERKAELVEGNTDTQTEADTENADLGGSEESASDEETVEITNWYEHIDGNGQGFEYVETEVQFLDYDADLLLASTVELEEFDSEYVKKLCDTVFDGGEVEVYDYANKTKRVYDDLIAAEEDLLQIYDQYKINNDKALGYYPFQLLPFGGWETRPNTEEFERSVIENDIERLKTERESAPETLENDYSYGGYIGKINGEEYYMFLGNKNYDEYLSAPETDFSGDRVVTIMKKDLETSYKGKSADDAEQSCPDIKKNAIVKNYTMEGLHGDIDPREDYLDTAKSFLTKIGYGSFENMPYETENLYWGSNLTEGFLNAKDFRMTVNKKHEIDGQSLLFEYNSILTGFPGQNLIELSDFDALNQIDTNTYVEMMVNDTGVIGCHIYNPARFIKNDEISGLLDRDDIVDIMKESINDKSLWVMPDRKVDRFTINDAMLLRFPVKSGDNENEYTYIPCYMFYNLSSEYTSPFIVINAIDGSIIDVEKELKDYPDGWYRGTEVE